MTRPSMPCGIAQPGIPYRALVQDCTHTHTLKKKGGKGEPKGRKERHRGDADKERCGSVHTGVEGERKLAGGSYGLTSRGHRDWPSA